jgi:hypothetical protein
LITIFIFIFICCGVLDIYGGEFSHFSDENFGFFFFNLKICQILVTRPKNQKQLLLSDGHTEE